MTEALTPIHAYMFYGAIVCMALAEQLIPSREQGGSMTRRWVTNIGLLAFSIGLGRLFLAFSAFIVAEAAAESGYGLLNQFDWPVWILVPLGLLFFDFYLYWEHRLLHGIHLFWRLHAVHHSDIEVDFTTAERHHPLMVLLKLGFVPVVIFLLGLSPLAVALCLIILPALSVVSHSNVRVHPGLERYLRLIFVTPAFHAVHHSAARHETNSNFGVLFTFWDRLFGTYQRTTVEVDAARKFGLEYFRDPRAARLDQVLASPFLPSAAYQEDKSTAAPDSSPAAT